MGAKGVERLRERFENRVTLTLTCRIVTPMFLGDACKGLFVPKFLNSEGEEACNGV